MKYLNKNTIKAFFLFARSTEEPATKNNVDETLPGILFDKPTKNNAYLEFLESLSTGEKAELTALYLLGTDSLRTLSDWEKKLSGLMKESSDDLEQANPQRIPQIIRHGLEKLARFNKSPSSPISLKDQAPLEPNERLINITGRFTLDSYMEKHGELDGMKRLITLLDIKGYLKDPADRSALGLAPIAARSPLETLHIDKLPS